VLNITKKSYSYVLCPMILQVLIIVLIRYVFRASSQWHCSDFIRTMFNYFLTGLKMFTYTPKNVVRTILIDNINTIKSNTNHIVLIHKFEIVSSRF